MDERLSQVSHAFLLYYILPLTNPLLLLQTPFDLSVELIDKLLHLNTTYSKRTSD